MGVRTPDSQELVSILMPVYNDAKTLPTALASVLAQTHENWECIVVDDGSTQEIARILSRFDDVRIRHIRFEQNHGRGFARYQAVSHARGTFVCTLDADDWMLPHKIERQLQVFSQNPDYALVSSGMFLIDEEGELLGVRRYPGRVGAEGREWGPSWELEPPPIPYAPSMIRTELAQRVLFDTTLDRSEDLDFLIRLLRGRRVIELSEPLYVYRVDATTKAWEEKHFASLKSTIAIYKKYFWYAPRKSLALVTRTRLKKVAYRVLFAAGLRSRILARWNREASLEEARLFEEALCEAKRFMPVCS